jgi:hypothetical protein
MEMQSHAGTRSTPQVGTTRAIQIPESQQLCMQVVKEIQKKKVSGANRTIFFLVAIEVRTKGM